MKYRPDIDGLRAIAVLSVVIFHTFPKIISGGFIGVDIFFVISGYLITGIITSGLKANSFSFITFYSKRILRIFPALIVVLGVSLVLGWFFLLPDEYEQLGKHVAGGGVFISNFLFWHESGYFDTAAELKPLLHLWSLAIEEQFYILWPFLLWAAYKLRINFLFSIVILWAISFYCNIGVYRHDGVADFYSPQTRFWELLTGGALVVATHSLYKFPRLSERLNKSSIANLTSILGIGLIVAGLILIDKSSIFPGYWALLPVCGATLLIASGPQALFNKHILSSKILVWIGLISYPLYLWHWVLLVFLRLLMSDLSDIFSPISNLEVWLPISVDIISLALAFLVFRYIERPFRKAKNKIAPFILILFMSPLVVFGCYAHFSSGVVTKLSNNGYQRIVNGFKWVDLWENEKCTAKYHLSPCQESQKQVEVMVIGDSHANHLFPGLDKNLPVGVLAAGACSPFDDTFVYPLQNLSRLPCATAEHFSKNIEILKDNPQIHTVLLAPFWLTIITNELINAENENFYKGTFLKTDNAEINALPRIEIAYYAIKKSIDTLYKLQKRVIFVRDNPLLKDDLKQYCKVSRVNSRINSNCAISREFYLSQRKSEDILIEKLRIHFPSLLVYDPIKIFCPNDECFLFKDGEPLYRDQHHLSVRGSELVGVDISRKFFLNRAEDH